MSESKKTNVRTPITERKVGVWILSQLFSVPTTSGTGSETTGVSVFGFENIKTKTGISNRALRPVLAIVDPAHTATIPERVSAFTGYDKRSEQEG